MKSIISLINSIKSGDEDSFTILLKENRGLIYKIINLINLNKGDFRIDEDTLFQEGSIALYDSVLSYDDSKGMSFSSYAYMVIRSRVVSYVRKHRALYDNETYSYDAHDDIDYRICFASDRVCDNPEINFRVNEFREYLQSFYDNLSNCDKEIFDLRADNHSYKDISRKTGLSVKKIDNRIMKVKRELRDHIDNEDSKTYIKSLKTRNS